MKSKLVQIGSSRGVRIPKALLEEAGLRDDVEIQMRGSRIVLRAAKRARTGWSAAFERIAKRGDDALLDADAYDASSFVGGKIGP